MPETTIKDLFPSPWGIVESRRSEIERSPFGAFEKIKLEETHRHLASAREVAIRANCKPGAVRFLMDAVDAGYILQDGVRLYLVADIERAVANRDAIKAARETQKISKQRRKSE